MTGNILKRGKGLYSEWFPEYRLTDEALKSLQACLLKMLIDFRDLCDENGIGYMVCGATLLGAVRHKGFVPWDDDIDIMMLREDFEKLKEVFEREHEKGNLTEYFIAEPLKSEDYYFKIPRIYNRNTEYHAINYMGNSKYNMVCLDIFPAEKIPENRLLRNFRSLVYDFAFYASSFCLDYMFPSPVIEEKCRENEEVRKFYSLRKRFGAVFAHLGGIRFYLKICDRLGRYSGKSRLAGLPSGISYLREVFDRSLFTETCEGDFCGFKVNIPRDYDKYLSNLYGDYMKIPPKEKREIHVAYKIKV